MHEGLASAEATGASTTGVPARRRTRLGHFDLHRRIGAGRFGVVYEATDRRSGRRIALKTLHRAAAVRDLVSLKAQFRTTSELEHPNIVHYHELGVGDGAIYCAMELIKGDDLVSWLRASLGDGGDGSEERIRGILEQLASGLRALHDRGLVHGDLKPGNVLVAEDDRLVLLDVGANHLDSRRSSITPEYAAPELLAGHQIRPSSDWYAVGVMLYEALVGELPFSGPLSWQFAAKGLSSAPRVAERRPDMPADLGHLTDALLAREPERRGDGADMARYAAGLPPRAVARLRPPSGPIAAPLVGRDEVIRQIVGSLADVAQGRTVVVHLRGERGIGKSSVLQRVLDVMRHRLGALVLRSRCHARDAMPFKVIDGALDELVQVLPSSSRELLREVPLRQVTQVFPALAELLDHEEVEPAPELPGVESRPALRRRAFWELKRLLQELSRHATIVFGFDDLQWGDQDSARLLTDLLSGPDGLGALVIACYRPTEDETGAFLEPFVAWDQGRQERLAVEIDLGPLEHGDATRLAEGLGLTPEIAARVAMASHGNPFLVELLSRTKGETTSRALSLEEAVEARLAALSSPSRELVHTLAVAGRPVERREVERAARLEDADWTVWREVVAERFARSKAGAVRHMMELHHEAIRDAILRRMSPESLASYHAAWAETLLATTSAAPQRLVFHLEASAQLEEAGVHAVAAGDEAAAVLAFDQAASYYRRALDLAKPGTIDQDGVRRKLARALADGGHGREAARVYLACVADAEGLDAERLRAEAVEQLLITGHVDEARRELVVLLERAGLSMPGGMWGKTLPLLWGLLRVGRERRRLRFDDRPSLTPLDEHQLAVCIGVGKGFSAYDPMIGAHFFITATRKALAGRAPGPAAYGLSIVGAFACYAGEPRRSARGLEQIEQAEWVARACGDVKAEAMCGIARAVAETCLGRWRVGLEGFDEAVRMLEERCFWANWELLIARSTALLTLEKLGDLRELEARVPKLVREGEERGDVALWVEATLYAALLKLSADAPDEAVAMVDGALAKWTSAQYTFQHWHGLRIRALAELIRGPDADALTSFLDERRALRRHDQEDMKIVRVENDATAGRLALALLGQDPARGDAKELRKLVARSVKALERERVGHATALEASLRAGLAALDGDDARLRRELGRATDAFRGADMGIHHDVCRARLAAASGDDAGFEAALGDLRDRGLVRPERWLEALVPLPRPRA